MTEAEAKRLFKPMLLKYPDLVWYKRWVFLKPIRHVARAFRMEGTLGKMAVRPIWGGEPLFQAPPFQSVQWFKALFSDTARSGRFDLEDADMQEQLFHQFETVALPGLHCIGELGPFLTFSSTFGWRSLSNYMSAQVYVEAAYGRFKAARTICEEFLREYPNWRNSLRDAQGQPMIEELYPLLLEENMEGVAARLRHYELSYVNMYGLGSIHEPTPFPLELLSP